MPWADAGLLPQAAFMLFVATTVLTFSAVKLGTTLLPVRFATLLASAILMVIADHHLAAAAVRRFKFVLFVIAAAAGLAAFASILSGTATKSILIQLAQIHLQAAVNVFVAGVLAMRFGTRPVALAIAAGFAVTALFAALQALGIGTAWDVRAFIGRLSADPPITQQFYERRERAMGLSFNPAVFGTQASVMLALLLLPALQAGRDRTRFRWSVIVWCAVIALLAIATGNRSPLLGSAIFLASYVILTKPGVAVIMLPLAVLGLLAAGPIARSLQTTEVRALKEDSSSENRGVLREFGVYLLIQRPLGYGLAFESTAYAEDYFDQVAYSQSPLSIRMWALHNYYLMVLAKHGLLLLLLVPLILPRTRRQMRAWWTFSPYLVHIFYHNDGPLQGDIVFFFVLPLALLICEGPVAAQPAGPVTRRPWRRAFGPAAGA